MSLAWWKTSFPSTTFPSLKKGTLSEVLSPAHVPAAVSLCCVHQKNKSFIDFKPPDCCRICHRYIQHVASLFSCRATWGFSVDVTKITFCLFSRFVLSFPSKVGKITQDLISVSRNDSAWPCREKSGDNWAFIKFRRRHWSQSMLSFEKTVNICRLICSLWLCYHTEQSHAENVNNFSSKC